MIFSDKLYPRPIVEMILDGTKTQTRRLVKEGECFGYDVKSDYDTVASTHKIKGKKVTGVERLGHPRKWQVGRDYAVQLGRGKPGLWHNLKFNVFEEGKVLLGPSTIVNHVGLAKAGWEPFRIVITGIRKERFCDISLDDAKKEGFKTTWDFMKAFCKVNKIAYEGQYLTANKEVWVLDFKIKEVLK